MGSKPVLIRKKWHNISAISPVCTADSPRPTDKAKRQWKGSLIASWWCRGFISLNFQSLWIHCSSSLNNLSLLAFVPKWISTTFFSHFPFIFVWIKYFFLQANPCSSKEGWSSWPFSVGGFRHLGLQNRSRTAPWRCRRRSYHHCAKTCNNRR